MQSFNVACWIESICIHSIPSVIYLACIYQGVPCDIVSGVKEGSSSYICTYSLSTLCTYIYMFVGSCLATTVFIGKLPATRRGCVIIR